MRSNSPEYLSLVLDKIGAPLLGAVMNAPRPPGTIADEAPVIAELLGKTVQTGIEISRSFDSSGASVSDSIRLSLTALAANLVAGSYRVTGKSPAEADIKRMTAALAAVQTFADNFTGDEESLMRLKSLSANDSAQAGVQYIHAMMPVIRAITAFSFGQPEQKIALDIASKLTAAAADMSRLIAGGDKLAELGLLETMCALYASCHEAETTRIFSLSESDRVSQPTGTAALEKVWANFELRLAVLEAIAGGFGNKGAGQQQSGGPSTLSPDAKAASATTPSPMQQTPPSTMPQGNANPMSFFKAPPKPPSDENDNPEDL